MIDLTYVGSVPIFTSNVHAVLLEMQGTPCARMKGPTRAAFQQHMCPKLRTEGSCQVAFNEGLTCSRIDAINIASLKHPCLYCFKRQEYDAASCCSIVTVTCAHPVPFTHSLQDMKPFNATTADAYTELVDFTVIDHAENRVHGAELAHNSHITVLLLCNVE